MEAGTVTPTPGGGRSILERSPAARLPDRLLKWILTGLSFAILVLLVYFFGKLTSESTTVFSQQGLFSYVFSNDWNPSARHFGAFAARLRLDRHLGDRADHRRPHRGGHRALHRRALPAAAADADDHPRRAARRRALGRLRPLGRVLPHPQAAAGDAVGLGHVLVPALGGRPRRGPELLHRRPDPRDHDPADRLGDLARGHRHGPQRPQGGGAGAGGDALGDDPHRRPALFARGHHRRRDARPRPRAGRDHRRGSGHRQRARRSASRSSTRAIRWPR